MTKTKLKSRDVNELRDVTDSIEAQFSGMKYVNTMLPKADISVIKDWVQVVLCCVHICYHPMYK